MAQMLNVDEIRRLEDLHRCNIMHTARDLSCDRIVFAVSQVMRVPIAAISFVDADEVWVKACVGRISTRYSRALSMSSLVVESNTLLIVPDARLHPQLAMLPTVHGAPYVRFMAGIPLRGPEGQPIGALCIADAVLRDIHPADYRKLSQFAHQIDKLICAHVADLNLETLGARRLRFATDENNPAAEVVNSSSYNARYYTLG